MTPPGIQKQKTGWYKGFPRWHAHGVWTLWGACLGSRVVSGWVWFKIPIGNLQTTEVWIVKWIGIVHVWTKSDLGNHLKCHDHTNGFPRDIINAFFCVFRRAFCKITMRCFQKLDLFTEVGALSRTKIRIYQKGLHSECHPAGQKEKGPSGKRTSKNTSP